MKIHPLKRTPVILALAVLFLASAGEYLSVQLHDHVSVLEPLERLTYDARVRTALGFSTPAATNLAFVALADSSIDYINKEYNYQFPWPRQVYGHLVDELSAQGARTVAFDILFGQLNKYDPMVQTTGGYVESDNFFAQEAHQAGNVLIAATPDVIPPDLFATNTLAFGDVSTEKDPDGILRRVKAVEYNRHWHRLLRKAADAYHLDLAGARIIPGTIILPQIGSTNVLPIHVDADNNFNLTDLAKRLPPGMPPKARAFTDDPIWQMGIQIAAQELHLDLARAVVDLKHGRITLRGPGGIERVIPVDSDGYFYVDWRLTPQDPRLTQTTIENLLEENKQRLHGATNLPADFADKLVLVGSSAQGNNLSDRGATPIERDTLLFSTYWNVANSVITDQFIERVPLSGELLISCVLGLLVAYLTWQMRSRIIYASLSVIGLIAAYVVVAFVAYIFHRVWLPLVFPVFGAMVAQHSTLIVYLVLVEQREKRRVKSVFSKIVAPDVVNELLDAENFSMVGSRREVTVLFADVRGFTKLTDESQEAVENYVREHQLETAAAENAFDESARETLETVNLYLARVADAVIAHRGTLDKYIGDCVMAFWGAPLNSERHAVDCVRAAIDAQRAIRDLNEARLAENPRREQENAERIAAGLPPKRPYAPLYLGSGINTGTVIVGLMGSEHIRNYTIFGREVNLASRLEGVSGSGRVVIGEVTYNHLRKFDPELAATCVELPSVAPKGFKHAVRIFEVPWQQKPV